MSSNDISLNVEETNALRAKLGLPLLKNPDRETNGPETRQAEEVANLTRYNEERAKDRQRSELIEKIKEQKELGALGKKPQFAVSKGLGEASKDDLDDTMAWASALKEKTTKRAKKIQKLDRRHQEEMLPKEYGEGELEGLKVTHDLQDLGHETILVLKDQRIGEDDGDELMNVTLADQERLRKNQELKKGHRQPTAYEEFERAQAGLDKKILSKYDDPGADDDETGFVLGSSGKVNYQAHIKNKEEKKHVDLGGISLDYDKNKEIADFYTMDEMMSFRKSKKKKKSSRKRKLDDEALPDPDGDVSMEAPTYEKFANSNKQRDIQSLNFVDDDDLQNALARSRKQANQKSNVALRVLEAAVEEDANTKDGYENGLVISDLTEFVENLSNVPLISDKPAAEQTNSTTNGHRSPEHTEPQANGAEEDDMDLDDTEEPPETEEPLEEVLSGADSFQEGRPAALGLAATLAILSQRGDIPKLSEEQIQKDAVERERLHWLAEQRKKDALAQRELEREKEMRRAGGSHKREDEYEYQQRQRDLERERARAAVEKFENYTPNIELHYRDATGRELSKKEAFKLQAQKFHGKTSGTRKTEKKLLKLEEELILKKMSSNDTPLGSNALFMEQAKSRGSTHITISKGGKTIVPPAKPVVTSIPTKNTSAKVPESKGKAAQPPPKDVEQQPFAAVVETSVPAAVSQDAAANRPKITFGLGGAKKIIKPLKK
ncbi:hypothetical protein HDV03_005223 [Kappamyces sp. JEL0829]|nr:hypothetical protein HDV03_005223 [Kappamyces sp. JEL0829]